MKNIEKERRGRCPHRPKTDERAHFMQREKASCEQSLSYRNSQNIYETFIHAIVVNTTAQTHHCVELPVSFLLIPLLRFLVFFFASALAACFRSSLYGGVSRKLNRPFRTSKVLHPLPSSSSWRHSVGYFSAKAARRFLSSVL